MELSWSERASKQGYCKLQFLVISFLIVPRTRGRTRMNEEVLLGGMHCERLLQLSRALNF